MKVNRERVLFHSGGLRMVGELYTPSEGGPWPGVVVCHGLVSRKERHADFAVYAAARGLAALTFDARGHGESEGRLDDRALDDVVAALAYLAARPEVDASRLSVRGSSIGGNLAIHTAAEHTNVRACVAICPAPEDLLAEGLDEIGADHETLPDVRIDATAMRAYLRSHCIYDAVGKIAPRALLLIHCRGDEVVPADVSESLYRLAGEPKEMWLLAGGSHTSAQHDPIVHERAIDWLLRTLTP